MPPVYWEDDEDGKERVRVELYESPTPPPKRDFGRYILMMVTAALTALIVSC